MAIRRRCGTSSNAFAKESPHGKPTRTATSSIASLTPATIRCATGNGRKYVERPCGRLEFIEGVSTTLREGYVTLRHSRESGNPVSCWPNLDSGFRRNDK